MKAVLVNKLGGIDDLILEDHNLPEPSSGQVLIDVKYAGINFPDLLIAKGLYQFQPELPFSPGGEVAGIVKALGAGVESFAIGDRVVSGTGWGGFAEEVLADVSNTHAIPEGVSFQDAAATLMTYGTVIHALKDRGQLKKGESLVVLGASGGVGSAAIQIGKLLGASVVACASNDEKLQFCKEIGADHIVNYSSVDLKSALKGLTSSGVDVVFDPVGGVYSEPAFRSIARGGRHLVVGFANGKVPALPWNLPLLKSASIVGVFWGGFFRSEPEANAANVQQLMKWLKDDRIKSSIQQIFPLKAYKEALYKVEKREVIGKLLFEL